MSSELVNGDRSVVNPVSALQLYRIGVKRRREICAGDDKRRLNDTTGNENGHSDNDDSSEVCLATNPFFSLPLGITELSGPAGVGKTQMALSLCADCVQPNFQGKQNKAVYIQLGGSSRFLQTISRRIEQMLLSRINAADSVQDPNFSAKAMSERVHECLARVLVHWVCNSEELMQVLQTSLPALLRQHPTVSVVVLDGIANLFRLVEEHQLRASNPWHDRAVTFFRISNLCKQLSCRFGVPFVVLNECTSRISAESKQATLEPALGLAWAQCVNASFFVSRCGFRPISSNAMRKDDKPTNGSNNRNKTPPEAVCHRILQCLRAPHIASKHSTTKFWIDRSGIVLA